MKTKIKALIKDWIGGKVEKGSVLNYWTTRDSQLN